MPLSEKGEQAVLSLFKLFDKNKNGVIETSELKDAEKLLHSQLWILHNLSGTSSVFSYLVYIGMRINGAK